MAVTTVRQGTVSSSISQLAAALLAKERQPIQALQDRRTQLNQQSTVLGTLKTRMSALRSALDNLSSPGTLSPFTAKTATSSDPDRLIASAGASAAAGTLGITVQQLARRSSHVSDVFTNTGTTLSAGGTGTFTFSLTIAGTTYNASVIVNAGDTDQTVLDNVAAAITTAVGAKGSAVRVQPEDGKARLSVSSADTGSANKLAFTDTDGLLARLGIVKTSPTAATDTTGGYIYDDLGNHELDAKLLIDGLTYYRSSNTVSDLVTGVTLNLKGLATSEMTVKVQPDADRALAAIKDFVAKYNDTITFLRQNTAIDPKAQTTGPLALDATYAPLASQLRQHVAVVVGSQPAGTANNLAALGIVAAKDGTLSITSEGDLKDAFTKNPAAFANLFNAPDGVATTLEAFVDGYSRATGTIFQSQNALTTRMSSLDDAIQRKNLALARKQAALEDQLARQQAVLDELNNQMTGINQVLNAAAQG